MGMMRYFHANICSASFPSLSTLQPRGGGRARSLYATPPPPSPPPPPPGFER